MESKMKKEVFILCPEPPEQLGGVEACVREQVRGFSKRGFDVRVFHKKNSGSAFYLRNAHRLSHHFTDTLVGFFVGRTAQKAMHDGVAAVFSHSAVGWYPLRVPAGCKKFHLYHGTYRGQAEAIRRFITCLGYLKLKRKNSRYPLRVPSGRKKFHRNQSTDRRQTNEIRCAIPYLRYLTLKLRDSMGLQHLSGLGKRISPRLHAWSDSHVRRMWDFCPSAGALA